MGKDPKTSVLNSNCQAHDCKNLFVTDGGPFVTNPDKNVTWTILALAMRTSEHIAEQRKAGQLMKRPPSLKLRRTSRREVLKVLLAAPAATFSWSDAEAHAGRVRGADRARGGDAVHAEVLHGE